MTNEITCWTLIHAAADGDREARERFARSYQGVIRAYLAARWQGRPDSPAIEDAVQDVFVECFKPDGVLEKADVDRRGGFRAYFLGVVRNIARKKETRVRNLAPLPDGLPNDDTSAARAFDKAWARALLKDAARIQEEHAKGDIAAERRVELLRLRFQDGLPIRTIAERWQEDAAWLHHEYAKAREEFRDAVRQVIRFTNPSDSQAEHDRLAGELFGMLV